VQGDGLGLVRVDPTQLEQVVVNLVVNARDAMAGDGLLTIATANVTLGEGHKQPPGDYVRLSITDTGSGIPPEILERIFDPFFTTKPEGKGTGLGLSTVYGIIEQHGGFVDVETAPGAGTTFRVYLPEAEGEEKPWATVDAECPCDGETILLVEDEEAVRHMESRVLASLGYQVLEASSAAEALDVLIGGTFKIDVVLTDVCMPKISGKQLADDVSLRWPGTKVILTSGYVGDTLDRRGVDELAYPFVHKPFNRRQVSAAIRGVLDGAPVEA